MSSAAPATEMMASGPAAGPICGRLKPRRKRLPFPNAVALPFWVGGNRRLTRGCTVIQRYSGRGLRQRNQQEAEPTEKACACARMVVEQAASWEGPTTEKKGRHMNANATDQIRELLTTYQDALNASDAETATSLYGADGVFLPYQLPTSSGDEIIGAYQAIFSAIRLDIAFTIDDVTVDGDTAHALTRSKGKVTVLADGTTAPEENRELFVFGRRDGPMEDSPLHVQQDQRRTPNRMSQPAKRCNCTHRTAYSRAIMD